MNNQSNINIMQGFGSLRSPISRPKSSQVATCRNNNLQRILSNKFDFQNYQYNQNDTALRADEIIQLDEDSLQGGGESGNKWIRIKGSDMISLIPKGVAQINNKK